GLIITGRAERPTYLHVWDGRCEFRDASAYWGQDSVAVQEGIQEELERDGYKTIVLQTGIAGENGVRFAAIVNNCKHFHGRCGLGAVMGSKRLKAIAVGGRQPVPIADPEKAKAARAWYKDHYNRDEDLMHLYGTSRGVIPLNNDGVLPTRHFRDGAFDQFENISGVRMAETILTRRGTCFACDVACKREVSVPELGVNEKYGGPEYETIAATGSLCGVGDLKQVALFNQLINGYVLDSISTGVTIAFAMEAYEKGILTKEQTGGLEVRYGDPEVVKTLIHQIARREGLGALLADGVKRAAEQLGPEAQKIALHVRGQELPMHEPRGKPSLGLAYALSPTGADHVEAPHDPMLEFVQPGKNPLGGMGLLEPVPVLELSPRKVRMFVYG
ncbi:MAG TPA: aldehyde ferredoxin oxidoreductase, partial [Planctomycetaceae bacterium]|nr:aldehyde ferredoxin oxidoreductase [Planctomycetaceae bacterium]